MQKAKLLLLSPLLWLGPVSCQSAGMQSPSATRVSDVTDQYHGVSVKDPYRWLEDGEDPEVKAWTQAQTAKAEAYLEALPGQAKLEAHVKAVMSQKKASYGSVSPVAGRVFLRIHRPPAQQSVLAVMPDLGDPSRAELLVDPNQMDPSGLTHIDWFVPSPDGKWVAVSISVGGSESGDVHLFEVATKKPTGEVIARVNNGTAGGDLAWLPDSSGFYYTRYPRGNERPVEDRDFYQQLYLHKLGEPEAKDRRALEVDLPRIAEIQVAVDKKSGRVMVTVQEGDGGRFAHYLKDTDGSWRQLSKFGDKILQIAFGPNEDLYILSRDGAPRGKVLHAPVSAPDLSHAQTLIEAGLDAIVEDFWGPPTVLPTQDRLYVLYQLGGPSTLRVFDLGGKPLTGPKIPDVSAVSSVIPYQNGVLFRLSSYLRPPRYLVFDPSSGKLSETGLFEESPLPTGDLVVTREFATSKDGTQIPVNIIHKKGLKLDGTHPAVVYGYGGYGVNLEPAFRLRQVFLANAGVVYAVANLRGGGEYGEAWHRQGNLENKQNVFDDFEAAIRWVHSRGYSKPARTGLLGGSNGGLLMGATLTQHPELAKAVVSTVGIYDMLRVELSPNGAFNVTEFGTVKNEAQFKALYAYSPYHRVKDGADYPAVLFLTGENDPRVDPMQSRKMTARLQAAAGSKGQIWLRTTADAGHGMGSSLDEQAKQDAYMLGFFGAELGFPFVDEKAP